MCAARNASHLHALAARHLSACVAFSCGDGILYLFVWFCRRETACCIVFHDGSDDNVIDDDDPYIGNNVRTLRSTNIHSTHSHIYASHTHNIFKV